MKLVFLGVGVGIVLVILVEVLMSYIRRHRTYDVTHREDWLSRLDDEL